MHRDDLDAKSGAIYAEEEAAFANRIGLAFYVYDSGAGGFREKMRLDGLGNVGINIAAPLAKLHIDQATAGAAIPVLTLDQADISEGLINFIASNRGVIPGATNSTTSVRVEHGGVTYRLALYANA